MDKPKPAKEPVDTPEPIPSRERYREYERRKLLLAEQVYSGEITWSEYYARVRQMLEDIRL